MSDPPTESAATAPAVPSPSSLFTRAHDRDIGRLYLDQPGADPLFLLQPLPARADASFPVRFTVGRAGQMHEETVYYAHLALLKLCKHYRFDSVLDIGSGQGAAARIFRHLGKRVTTVEVSPTARQQQPPPDHSADYLDAALPEPVDAIWCSHVLEHVRNPGAFLDKIYDDLRDGGVLALTVPLEVVAGRESRLVIGHYNKYTPLLLVYQLICSGFDCRDISLCVYAEQISVLLVKVPNRLPRATAALYGPLRPELTPAPPAEIAGDPRYDCRNLADFFPLPADAVAAGFPLLQHQWGDPI